MSKTSVLVVLIRGNARKNSRYLPWDRRSAAYPFAGQSWGYGLVRSARRFFHVQLGTSRLAKERWSEDLASFSRGSGTGSKAKKDRSFSAARLWRVLALCQKLVFVWQFAFCACRATHWGGAVNGWNIQGMIALVKKSEPVALSGGLRFLALILGLLSIAGLSFLVSYIDTKMIWYLSELYNL